MDDPAKDPKHIRDLLRARRERLARFLGHPSVRHKLKNLEAKLGHILPTMTCPACGYFGLTETEWGICYICGWDDDGRDDFNSSEDWAGSLDEARELFIATGRANGRIKSVTRVSTDRALILAADDAMIAAIKRECELMLGDITPQEFVAGIERIRAAMTQWHALVRTVSG